MLESNEVERSNRDWEYMKSSVAASVKNCNFKQGSLICPYKDRDI